MMDPRPSQHVEGMRKLVDVYLTVGGEKIFFRERPEQNLRPRHHAEICREALERRGYDVEGPFDDVDEQGN